MATAMIANEQEADETAMFSDDAQWAAVLGRDAAADGMFVYAVRSTGIYCRPSCPSRRPLRERVMFFGLPEAAEHAGFRACLRCRPAQTAMRDPQVEMVRRVCRAIEDDPDRTDLATLGAVVAISPAHLQRTFKRLMSISPRQYAEACRVRDVKARLHSGEAVTNALYDAGYGSSSRLYERAPATLGMTPATYRKGGAGATIRYTVASSPLGALLVAATERGLCAVRLGDDADALVEELRHEFPFAALARDADDALGAWVAPILANLGGTQPHLDLPLDVQATAFQWRVWEALRAIPRGETRSYAEVARAIGQPTAARAVARACATNPVALAIPCHRVVRGDGDPGGYRWGMERKRALLAREAGGT